MDVGYGISHNIVNLTLPDLVQVDHSLSTDGNLHVRNLSLPSPESVGGLFQIAENPLLDSLHIGNLTNVESLDFTGSFDRYGRPTF